MYIIDVHHFKSRLLLCGENQTIDLNLNKRNFGFRCVKKTVMLMRATWLFMKSIDYYSV